MFRICWNKILIWAPKYFELHFHISFYIVIYRKMYYQARGTCFPGTRSLAPYVAPRPLGPPNLFVTVSSNRLLGSEWSIKIIHKNVLQKINVSYQQNNFLCLICTRYIFHLAICQVRHRGSVINKHNKY